MGFRFVLLGAFPAEGSDPFHVCKYGIGRHFCASALIVVASWNTWGAAALNFDERMARAFEDFSFCCSVELRGTPHCKAFTRDGLHFDRETSYPWAGWKGSDTMLVLRWLVRLIRHGILTDAGSRSGNGLLAQPPGPEDLLEFQRDVLQAVLDGACAMIRFFQILNHTGAWLDSNAAHKVAFHVHMFCASYYFLAGRCQNKGLCRFHLEPSLHMFRHMGLRVQHLLDKGCQWILSPACFLAESSEDFVGQVARLARRTSARSTCTRTIQRYLIKCHFDYKDLTR